MIMKPILDMLDAIAAQGSTIEKKKLIAEYSGNEWFVKVVLYALDPYKMYNMTGTITYEPAELQTVEVLFDELDYLSTLRGLTDEKRAIFVQKIRGLGESACIIANRILNKDLRCGAQIALFKAASPEVYKSLTEHHPTKGLSDLPSFLAHMQKKDAPILGSGKLDGARCWVVYDCATSVCVYLSFNGKEFTNFNCFDEEVIPAAQILAQNIKATYGVDLCTVKFDGEVENIDGDFQQLMSDFRRLNECDNTGFRFRIFDWVPPKDIPILANLPYITRDNELTLCLEHDYDPSNPTDESKITRLAVFELSTYTTVDRIEKLRDEYIDVHGKEGLMLKDSSAPYEHKKGKTWCKVKRFDTLDLPVVGVAEGTGKNAGTLGALICEYKGKKVKVGSGYSDEQRTEFWFGPPKCIEVKYQEETKAGSLRFPVFVRRRDDKD